MPRPRNKRFKFGAIACLCNASFNLLTSPEPGNRGAGISQTSFSAEHSESEGLFVMAVTNPES